MISGIKIYRSDGTLKEEISEEKARELYNETNKENWSLTPTERRHWNNMLTKEPKDTSPKGLQPWIKRTHKVKKRYKIKCSVCNTEVVKSSIDAKYCGKQCYGVARRRMANKNYKQRKGVSMSQL